jgi:hypothetical protein
VVSRPTHGRRERQHPPLSRAFEASSVILTIDGPASGIAETHSRRHSELLRSLVMDLGLQGKTAIVAAASQGLGKAVALAFAGEGANVVMFSRNPASIDTAANDVHNAGLKGSQLLGLTADVTRPSDLERVVKATVDAFVVPTFSSTMPAVQSPVFSMTSPMTIGVPQWTST